MSSEEAEPRPRERSAMLIRSDEGLEELEIQEFEVEKDDFKPLLISRLILRFPWTTIVLSFALYTVLSVTCIYSGLELDNRADSFRVYNSDISRHYDAWEVADDDSERLSYPNTKRRDVNEENRAHDENFNLGVLGALHPFRKQRSRDLPPLDSPRQRSWLGGLEVYLEVAFFAFFFARAQARTGEAQRTRFR